MSAKLRKIKLSVMFLREGKRFVAYSPALDISTSAPTFKKAKEKFEELVDIFFDELVKMGTLEDVLAECGWRKSDDHYTPPRFISRVEETFKIPCPS